MSDDKQQREVLDAVIRGRLGLQPWDEYAANAKSRDGIRGTGRTTRMLVQAMAAVMSGKQVIVYAENIGLIRDKLRMYMGELNLPLKEVRAFDFSREPFEALHVSFFEGGCVEVFRDHHRKGPNEL